MYPSIRVIASRVPWSAVSVLLAVMACDSASGLARDVSGQISAPRKVAARDELAPDEQRTIQLFERSRGSVVFITTRERVVDLWTRNVLSIPRGTGSGFVWDERGNVVTNYHVIAGASEARVRLNDGREVPAVLVGASPAHDLAVLRVNLSRPPTPVPLGTSHDLRVGQKVFAIGNPFGLDWTLTTGIVSALDRSLPAEDGHSLIEHLIQTDAAINPGNSGGPLLDSAGRLIGINTAIYSPSGAYAGVGFAVPVDTVARVVPQLVSTGRYVRPTLGIEVDESLNAVMTRQLGRPGVLVLRSAPGSPAQTAGLRGVQVAANGEVTPGDIILAVNGEAVESVARLLARLDDHQVGETVRLTVWRDGREAIVPVKLQSGG